MEKKTKKKLLKSILLVGVGIPLFFLGIFLSSPNITLVSAVVGLTGSFISLLGIMDTCEYLIKGIKESIVFHKQWKNRENSTKNIAAEKNYTVQTETLTLKKIPKTKSDITQTKSDITQTKSNIPKTEINEDIFTR